MTDNRKELKKALNCLFIAVDSSVAWDIQKKVDAVIAELESAGDQMVRAIEYSSGVSFEFAVKEWKEAVSK